MEELRANHGCPDFRRLLEEALAGRPDPPRLVELGWHEHLLGCGDCRELLEAEEALELLLASLPDPQLPPELRRRVLGRLRETREAELERLLDLDRVATPVGLETRVVSGVHARLASEDAKLDELLERAGVVEVPAGLAARVLAGVESARPARLRLVPAAHSWRLRAAALLLVGFSAAMIWRATQPQYVVDRSVASVRDEDVIQSLAVLEYWDALQELDPLEQEIVVQLDLTDAALLVEEAR